MKVTCTVKLLGEEKNGISQRTGNPWKSKTVLLEWLDLHGTNRVWGSLFNQSLDEFNLEGIAIDDKVEACIRYSTRTYRSGYTSTEVELISIKKV